MFLVRLNNNTNAEYEEVEELAANIDNIFGIFFKESPDFDTVKNLLEVIKNSNGINFINFSNCELPINSIELIANAIKANVSIKNILLSSCEIDDEGLELITEALKTNTKLKKLDLSENDITKNGVDLLLEVLKTNTSLTKVELYDNKFTDEQVMQIAQNSDVLEVEQYTVHEENILDQDLFSFTPNLSVEKELEIYQRLTEAFKSELAGYEESFRDKFGKSDKRDKEPSL